jgi:nitric oxide reductase NorE protein
LTLPATELIPSVPEPRVLAREPGTDGLWTFVFIDMLIFLLIFLTFMEDRLGKVGVYAASQLELDEIFGLTNTLILLTSSWMMAEGVRAARAQAARGVSRYLGLTVALGLIFIANKIVEYTLKVQAGITPATNSFFSYYYFLTFVHLLHVVAGVGFIAYFRRLAPTRTGSLKYQIQLENVGLFWHFVDVIWIFIFPLLYLVGRP